MNKILGSMDTLDENLNRILALKNLKEASITNQDITNTTNELNSINSKVNSIEETQKTLDLKLNALLNILNVSLSSNGTIIQNGYTDHKHGYGVAEETTGVI